MKFNQQIEDDGQLLKRIVSWKACRRQFISNKCPFFRKKLTTCSSWISRREEKYPRKSVADARADLGAACASLFQNVRGRLLKFGIE